MNAAKFEINFEKNLLNLENELKSRVYKPGKYTCFAITDPKLREVWAADFRDRIVHHLLVNYLEPVFEKKFIFHSYACRREKGAHKAVGSLKKTLYGQPDLYYLQADIRSFFVNIDKNILCSIIGRHIGREDVLWLAEKIIRQNPVIGCDIHDRQNLLGTIPGHKSLFFAADDRGLPIGNLTSQFFANTYLNELDQFVKHRLKCRYYWRYMDDFVILHADKFRLIGWRNEISEFLKDNLRLELHPQKRLIRPARQGLDFLGYIVKPGYSLSRRRVVSKLKRKLHYFNKKLDEKTGFEPEKERNLTLPLVCPDKLPAIDFILNVQEVINSYWGHFRHANCLGLKKKLYFFYFKEVRNFLEPAGKDFSHFVIPGWLKVLYRNKNKPAGYSHNRRARHS